MTPNHSNEQTGLSLPPPEYGAKLGEVPAKTPNKDPDSSFESKRTINPPALSNSRQTAAADPPIIPIPTTTSDDNGIVPAISQPSATPISADDNDLIEKEWVSKAKAIVEKTKEDPYVQTKEMSRFRADYIKKRYDKDIKVADE